MYIKYQIFQRHLWRKLFLKTEIRESDLKICNLQFAIYNSGLSRLGIVGSTFNNFIGN